MSKKLRTLDVLAGERSAYGDRAFLRGEINASLDDYKNVTDANRICQLVPTIHALRDMGFKITLGGHLQVENGGKKELVSTKHLVRTIQELTQMKVTFVEVCVGEPVFEALKKQEHDEIILLENLRFYSEEKACDRQFMYDLFAPFDIYVNDAFGALHREHASMMLGDLRLGASFAGRLIEKELSYFANLAERPSPKMCIVGGSKADDKIGFLKAAIEVYDTVVVVGGVAHNFLQIDNPQITPENSRARVENIETVKEIFALAKQKGKTLMMPIDVVAHNRISQSIMRCELNEIPRGWELLDIGIRTVRLINAEIARSRSLIWNGPAGFFEKEEFSKGTRGIAEFIAERKAEDLLEAVICGGNTGEAIVSFGLEEKMSWISTGGGVILKLVTGETLPALETLME